MENVSPVVAHLSAYLDTQLKAKLVELARQNERSTSAELRVAVRQHVDEAAQRNGKDAVAVP